MSSKCIKEEYDNCGPPAEGDYCLFHKPKKNEKESKRFYEEIKKIGKVEEGKTENGGENRLIFNNSLDLEGFVFPKVPGEIKFPLDNAIFEKEVFFSDAIFRKEANFFSVEFKESVFFHNVKFEEKSSFTFAKFREIADFSEAKFRKKSDFKLANFDELVIFSNAQFGGEAGFDHANFQKGCNFTNVTIDGNAIFSSANFGGDALMNETYFRKQAIFEKVNFKEKSVFKNSVMINGSNFKKTDFKKDALFKGVSFIGRTTFEEANFKNDSSFTESKFRKKADFNESIFEGLAVFNEAIFSEYANFEKTDFQDDSLFENIIFERSSSFIGSKFGGNLSFKHSNFKQGMEIVGNPENNLENRCENPKSEIEAYRVQRMIYEDEGRKDEADEMLVHEMRARRKQKNSLTRFFETLFADWTCKYGTSWKRIIANSGFIISAFAIIFWFTGVDKSKSLGSKMSLDSLLSSFSKSISNFTTLGYENNPTGTMELLTGIEALIGSILIVLLVVVFARKWMR